MSATRAPRCSFGTTPSKGDITRTEELANWTTGPVYLTTGRKVYDAYGRVNRQTHADGSTVRTDFDGLGLELRTVVEGYTGHPDEPTAPTDTTMRSMAYDPANGSTVLVSPVSYASTC